MSDDPFRDELTAALERIAFLERALADTERENDGLRRALADEQDKHVEPANRQAVMQRLIDERNALEAELRRIGREQSEPRARRPNESASAMGALLDWLERLGGSSKR